MTEKSGLEMIENIKTRLELIERRFANMELMIKELLNRTNKNEHLETSKPMILATAELTKTMVVPQSCTCLAPVKTTIGQTKQEVKIGDSPVNLPAVNSDGKIKILGQIKNKDGRLVSGVNVKVFNNNNKMIKETKTNRAGEWMCLLPSGKYKAEYFLENMVNDNVNFNALPGQTLVRVAQPINREG
ncbi:MAG: hypothetical protein WC516_08260 [Patescibacteria group bacterium]|jgi:hypothetical protein